MIPLSILVVDPSADRWNSVDRGLEPHCIAWVYCGADALAALALLRFDLIILDSVLPDIDSPSVTRTISQLQPWAQTIALSDQNLAPTGELTSKGLSSRALGGSLLGRAVAFALATRDPQLN